MKGFFSVDGGLYKFMSRLLDMLKLNLMVVCLALPFIAVYIIGAPDVVVVLTMLLLIPMGASLVAGYTITLRMISDEEGYIIGPFIKEFRNNFKKGCALGALFLVPTYCMYLDFQLYRKASSNNTMFLIVFIVGVILIITHFLYAFPLLARYENTVWNTLKNSHSIAIRFFPRTIFLVILIAVEVVFFIFNNITVFLGILIGPACIMLTVSANIRPIFAKIEDETGMNDDKAKKDNESEKISNDSNVSKYAGMNTKLETKEYKEEN